MHKTDDLFLAAMRKPEVVDIVEGMFGEEASGIQSGFFFTRPGAKGFCWHQDNIYVESKPGDFVLAWTALCDMRPENGCLVVFPGTHLEPILPVRDAPITEGPARDEGAYDGESIVPERYTAHDVVIPKGSTVFLHGHMVHGSHDNRSDGFRCAMFHSYIRKGAPFRRGDYAKRAEVSLHVGATEAA